MSFLYNSALCAALLMPSAAITLSATEQECTAAHKLVRRVTPQYSNNIRFGVNPEQKSPTIQGLGKSIYISAENERECIRAYGYYLRNIAKVHLSWNGDNIRHAQFIVPTRIITVPAARPFNYAFNYCTLSYTTVTWDKQRWEKELDRLALNGVRYVLVTSGLEKVWQNFLTELDYPQEKIAKFIPNPCYAAWWNMGNLEGEGAPVSQSLIESEAELGRFIVRRLKELGMEPVLQGYVGFLPHDFPQAGINGKLIPQGKWCGYKRPVVLQPTAPAFADVAALWYKHLHQVYGTTAVAYGGDLFHEGGRKADTSLYDAAKAVQKAMQQASPGCKWLIQAWGHNPEPELLKGTDPEHTVILALQKDLTPRARLNFDFKGRPFVWCELSNFGGKHGMFGGMDVLENLTDKNCKAIGIGLISEGLETSPLFYALLWERMNTPAPIKRQDFLVNYSKARYGTPDKRIILALQHLAGNIYTPNKRREGSLENIMCARPNLSAVKATTWADPTMYYKPESIEQAARLYLQAGKIAGTKLTSQPTYRYDLADLCRQVLADRARAQLKRCKQAFDAKDIAKFTTESNHFLSLIRQSSEILATSEFYLLGRYIDGAKGRGTTPEDKQAMERNLRQLITTWRPDIGVLNDYSHRQFAEMMQHYYLPRWQSYFNARKAELSGKHADNEKIIRGITTNNGEAVEHVTIRNKEIETIEKGFIQADIPLLIAPRGDIMKLAESILK